MRGETSQASAISSTVVPSKPWRAEQLHRGFLQRLAGAGLLPFPEAHGGGHGHILAHEVRLATAEVCQLAIPGSSCQNNGAMSLFTSPTDAHTAEQAYARRWWTLAVLCLSLLIVFGGNSTLNVALPTLSRDLGATESQLQWVVASYSLVFAGLLFTSGALGDRFGRKGALQFGLATFFLASAGRVAGDRAPRRSSPAARSMGLGAAFIMPSTLSILVNVFPPQERAKAIAIWATTTGVAGLDRSRDHRLRARALLVRLRLPRVPAGDRARVRRRLVLRAQVARPRREQPSTRSARCCRSSVCPRSSSGSSRRPKTDGSRR